jgi:hypothetical protein
MQNIYILDLETRHLLTDCQQCTLPSDTHVQVADEEGLRCPGSGAYGRLVTHYAPIGWEHTAALGLNVGCYYDTIGGNIHWFDEDTLEVTMCHMVEEQPLLVSFNGLRFDFPIMRGLLRRRAETHADTVVAATLTRLCDVFKFLCARSYDILAEIWKVDSASKTRRGLNSLDALAQANGLGAKHSHGAQAPRDWAAGRWASVLNHCQDDVYKTRALFEMVLAGEPIKRSDGSALLLPRPRFVEKEEVKYVG